MVYDTISLAGNVVTVLSKLNCVTTIDGYFLSVWSSVQKKLNGRLCLDFTALFFSMIMEAKSTHKKRLP